MEMDAYVRAGRGTCGPRGDGVVMIRGLEGYLSGHERHHEDLAFYPAGYYNPGFYSPLSTKPSCLVRITRDAGQNATGLIIDEFNWYFPRTEIGRLRVNTEFIRS